MQKITLRLFSCIGILLFAPLFAATFLDASLIERSAGGFIEWKIGNEAKQKIDAIQIPKSSKLEQLLGDKAKEMLAKTDADIEQIKSQLKSELPSILANELAKLRNLDCECRKKWEQKFEAGFLSQLSSWDIQRQHLIEFSRTKYMDIVTQLTIDIRIFLGSNLAVFSLMLLISLLKPKAIQHLFFQQAFYFYRPLCVHIFIYLSKIGFLPLSTMITPAMVLSPT